MKAELLTAMWDNEVRVGQVIHIQGALVDAESPSESMKEFLDDLNLPALEAQWPGVTEAVARIEADLADEREEHPRSAEKLSHYELGEYFARRCPKALIVVMESTVVRYLSPDPAHEGGGTYASGWGYYRTRPYLVDTVEEACELEVEAKRAAVVSAWRLALQEKSDGQ